MFQRKFWAVVASSALLCAGCAGGMDTPFRQMEDSHEAYRKMMGTQRKAGPQDEAPSATAEQRMSEGDELRARGELPKAMFRYLQAFRLDPEDQLPKERIAYLHMTREPERSEVIFNSIVAEHPERASAYEGRGLAQLAGEKLQLARASLTTAIDLDPDSWASHSALGVVYDRLGESGQARTHYAVARGLRPDEPRILGNLGVSYMLTGEYERAVNAFHGALDLGGADPAMHNNLGVALVHLERYDAALAAFRARGSEQAAQNNMGYAYMTVGRYDRAIDHFESALLADGDAKVTVLHNLTEATSAASVADSSQGEASDLP